MKKLWKKIKDWLIDKLGGYTKEDMNLLYKSEVAVRRLLMQAWVKTVQEICRKSNDTYYDWCCEYCGMTCDKRNGWCEKFMPVERPVLDDNICKGGVNNERHC